MTRKSHSEALPGARLPALVDEAMEAVEEYSVPPTLARDRLLEIRRRLKAGEYDEPGVLATIASRILEKGEL